MQGSIVELFEDFLNWLKGLFKKPKKDPPSQLKELKVWLKV